MATKRNFVFRLALFIVLAGAMLISLSMLRAPASWFHALLAVPVVHLFYTDLRTYRVHLVSIIGVFGLGFLWACYQTFQAVESLRAIEASIQLLDLDVIWAGIRTVCVAVFFWLLNSLYQRVRGVVGIATGDILIFSAAAVWLPLYAFSSFVLVGCAGALALAILRMLRKNKAINLHSRLPLGGFLAGSLWLTSLFVLVSPSN